MNWRGRPLISHEVIIETISAVTTRTGLKVTAVLDTGIYPKGIRIPDKDMKAFEARHLQRHEFHGNWNYTVPADPPGDTTRRMDRTRAGEGSQASSTGRPLAILWGHDSDS